MFEDSELFDILFGGEYEKNNPEIKELNVFSVSSLAYSEEKQFDWKMNNAIEADILLNVDEKDLKEINVNFFMLLGRAVHELIQSRLSSDFQKEKKITLELPYNWKNANFHSIKIIGHIDAINFTTGELLELKTSIGNKEIADYHIEQCGFYARYLELFANTKTITAKVKKIHLRLRNHLPKIKELIIPEIFNTEVLDESDKQIAYDSIVAKAYRVAEQIDKQLGQKGLKIFN